MFKRFLTSEFVIAGIPSSVSSNTKPGSLTAKEGAAGDKLSLKRSTSSTSQSTVVLL